MRSVLLAAIAAVSILAASTPAQTPARASRPAPVAVIDAAVRRDVVDTIASEFIRLYVDADTGRMIAEHIRARERAGAYDQLSDPRRFAEALTADLQSVNGDKHLFANYAPGAPFDHPGAHGIVDDSGSATPPSSPQQAEAARRTHWDLPRVEVLTGNVGYMKVTGFEGSQGALDATSAALKYLEGTDAMIFDFRGMGGGSGEQSNFLISHFTGADTVASLVISNRSSGSRRVRYTMARVPGTRRPSVPIWILTDRGTASAGEDFSFVLQQMGRASTVGDRTAGAGHNNDFVDVGHGFGVSISYTRVADPRSGKEWERVGVRPDIPADPRNALAVAHAAALDSLTRITVDPRARTILAAAREGVLAGMQHHVVPAAKLSSYAGTYEGGRVIAVDNGMLVFRRNASRPPRPYVAVNDSTFVLDDMEMTFARGTGGVMQMTQHLPDGSLFTLPRIGDAPADLAQ